MWIVLSINNSRYQCWQVSVLIWPTELSQGAQYESTIIFSSFEIYNVNYKGEVRTQYLGFREKNNFYFLVSDTSQLAQNRSSRKGQQLSSPSAPVYWQLSVQLILPCSKERVCGSNVWFCLQLRCFLVCLRHSLEKHCQKKQGKIKAALLYKKDMTENQTHILLCLICCLFSNSWETAKNSLLHYSV